MKFEVEVSSEWTEPGTCIVSADSKEEAEELVKEMLANGDDSITWHGSNMDPGADHVESVTEIATEAQSGRKIK